MEFKKPTILVVDDMTTKSRKKYQKTIFFRDFL